MAAAPTTDRGIADVYVGDATVTFVSRPRRAPNDDSGLWIARHLLQGAITLHVTPLIGLRLSGFNGFHQGALQAAPTSLRVPDADVSGFAWGVVANVPIDRHALLASVDFGVMGVPSYIECSGEDCQIASDEQRDTIFHAVANAGYAYRVLDALRPQLTVTLQNHPSNDEAFISSTPDAEVEHGPLYATVALVVEWQPVEWLGVAPAFQWPLTRSPIEYGPIIGFGVRGIWPEQVQLLE